MQQIVIVIAACISQRRTDTIQWVEILSWKHLPLILLVLIEGANFAGVNVLLYIELCPVRSSDYFDSRTTVRCRVRKAEMQEMCVKEK